MAQSFIGFFRPVFFSGGSAKTDQNCPGRNSQPVPCDCSLDHCMRFHTKRTHLRKVPLQNVLFCMFLLTCVMRKVHVCAIDFKPVHKNTLHKLLVLK